VTRDAGEIARLSALAVWAYSGIFAARTVRAMLRIGGSLRKT
jgi:hypothetical protein